MLNEIVTGGLLALMVDLQRPDAGHQLGDGAERIDCPLGLVLPLMPAPTAVPPTRLAIAVLRKIFDSRRCRSDTRALPPR
ncbi:MAG: hypothetical protein WDN48_17445 [Pseudolabrys sp.]